MIIKGRTDTCQEPTELQMIGRLTETNLDSKIQIKYVDTKNQFADKFTK